MAESYEALANHYLFLPSTQVSSLKELMAMKGAVLTQRAVKGEKGDGGERGQTGPPGTEVSMTKSVLD